MSTAGCTDILAEAIRRGAKLRRYGQEYIGPCPRCGGRDRFSINVQKQIFFCRQGGVGGDVVDLVRYLDGVDYRGALILLGLECGVEPRPHFSPAPSEVQIDQSEADRIAAALATWRQCLTLGGTLGERYFKDHRSLDIRELGGLTHCLRWHEPKRFVVALMTDSVTNEPIGVHRTFLDGHGQKIERKMLGRQGVVRLSADATVTNGLGLAEGVEDGIAVLLSGWAPVWAATSAGAIERFPILSGIETLTIFSDADVTGMTASNRCISRYLETGRQARVCPPAARLQHAA